ncbi:MAG: methanogenesis marker 16 metalloprotein [Candidatus Lokiarchaeota archaeon]|nr:methanogenesis marker 16 metalloprotein [Candidatus Lokiarchaeota archaeon]
MVKTRSIGEIKKKIEEGNANVFTAEELMLAVENGETFSFDDIDVVTTASKGLMSGTTAILSFKVSEPRLFRKAIEISLNDIRCHVGPCPNEYLGRVDLFVFGTDKSKKRSHIYGGGNLFRDIVEGREIRVESLTVEGKFIESTITLEEMDFARMFCVRAAFRNYNSFINPGANSIKSIFTVTPMKGFSSELSFCGTGILNPLENDPNLDIIGVGTPILMNNALGFIIDHGTRSSQLRPNLMSLADMKEMDPFYMGGFKTSVGPEPINTWAIAIPILNEKIFNNLKFSDKDAPLSITDIVGRGKLEDISYGDVWKKNYVVKFDHHKCPPCDLQPCPVEELCPTNCFSVIYGIDKTKCFNCGTCVNNCPEAAFECNLGAVKFQDKEVPIKLRQSDRYGALKLAEKLKDKVLNGQFPLNEPVHKITIR